MIGFRVFLFFIITFVIANYAQVRNLQIPSSLKTCQRNSPNLAGCIKESIEHIRPFLKTGDLGNGLKLDGIEPLPIDNIYLERGSGFFFNLLNIKAYNIYNLQVEKIKVRVNPDSINVDIIINIPKVDSLGDYKINLFLGLITIKGEGKFKSQMDYIRARVKLVATKNLKNGVEYMRFTKAETKVKIGDTKMILYDLFKDKILNDVGQRIVNENLPMFHSDFEPKIEKSIERTILKIGNQILDKIPYSQLFP